MVHESKEDKMNEEQERRRAQAFHEAVAPFFQTPLSYTLIDACTGDGKAGLEFSIDRNVSRIIFVDIKEPRRFQRNVSRLRIPFEVNREGIETLLIPENSALIAVHACGMLTDIVLEKATQARIPVAVMPCCYNAHMKQYDLRQSPESRRLLYAHEKDYYDAIRARFLEEQGYKAQIVQISPRITPMNNVLIGIPRAKLIN